MKIILKFKSTFLTMLLVSNLSCFAASSDTYYPDKTSKTYNYEISIDSNRQTAFTGADLSMSLIEGYRMLDDKLTADSDAAWVKALMIIPRYMITSYVTTFQHEVFGHGARVREIGQGWKVRSYKLSLDGSGETKFIYNKSSDPQYNIAVDIGGVQATEVLGNKIKGRLLESQKVDPVYGAAYFVSAGDQLNYTLLTQYKGAGHDIKNYISGMNSVYGNGYLTKAKVKSTAALGLLDPFLYYSAYSLGSGEEFEYPMLPVGDWKYLPAFRGVFTPYGLERKWLNYFKAPSTPLQLNFTQGNNKRGTSWAVEFIMDKVFTNENIDIGFNIATWKQPKMFFIDPLKAPKKQGGAGEVNIKLNLNDTSAIYTAIGYKTAGFRVGYPLRASGLIRMGLAFKI